MESRFSCEKRAGLVDLRSRDKRGVTTVEYGIIISLITVTAFAVFPTLQDLWSLSFDLEESAGTGAATLMASPGTTPDDPAAPSPEPDAAPVPPPYNPPFLVQPDGSIQVSSPNSPTIVILGSAITYGAGGPEVPVKLQALIEGTPQTIFHGTGGQVTPASGGALGNLPTGTRIDFQGKSFHPTTGATLYTKSTSTGNPMIIALRNGDAVPDKTPFGQQPEIRSFLTSVIDPVTKKVSIAPNEVLYLMELGTSSTTSPAADFQDLVFKVIF